MVLGSPAAACDTSLPQERAAQCLHFSTPWRQRHGQVKNCNRVGDTNDSMMMRESPRLSPRPLILLSYQPFHITDISYGKGARLKSAHGVIFAKHFQLCSTIIRCPPPLSPRPHAGLAGCSAALCACCACMACCSLHT